MLTNRLELPSGIVAAITNDPYTRGSSNISVTQLIAPAYQRKLRESIEPVEDVADRIWSLLGQSVHSVLERAYSGLVSKAEFIPREFVAPLVSAMVASGCTREQIRTAVESAHPDYDLTPAEFYDKHGWTTERRLFTEVNGWTLSGQYDVIEHGVLQDFKVTSTWSLKEPKLEWEQQLNLLNLLAARAGVKVERLRIIALLRDWSKGASKRDSTYPQSQVAVVDIPMWPLAKTEAYAVERVIEHQLPTPAPCSDEERWKTEDVFAVVKEGRKTAVKLHDSSKAAAEHVAALGKGHSVVLRAGEYRRCAEYCNVAHACPQYTGEVPF